MIALRHMWKCIPDGMKQFIAIMMIGLPMAAVVTPVVFFIFCMLEGLAK